MKAQIQTRNPLVFLRHSAEVLVSTSFFIPLTLLILVIGDPERGISRQYLLRNAWKKMVVERFNNPPVWRKSA